MHHAGFRAPWQAQRSAHQSMTVELMVAKKRWLRTRNASPTGEAVKATCRLDLTCGHGAMHPVPKV